jgi:hypothetical protein
LIDPSSCADIATGACRLERSNVAGLRRQTLQAGSKIPSRLLCRVNGDGAFESVVQSDAALLNPLALPSRICSSWIFVDVPVEMTGEELKVSQLALSCQLG